MLQHGLLRASYVPQRPQQELRDLTRHRAQLVGEHTRVANRIHKTLEDANIKLAAVASDILGVSGREMIWALIRGQEDPATLADLARHTLRAKIPQLQEALHGRVTEHHRFMLRTLMGHLQYLESTMQTFNTRIEELTLPFADQIQHRSQVPGLDTAILSFSFFGCNWRIGRGLRECRAADGAKVGHSCLRCDPIDVYWLSCIRRRLCAQHAAPRSGVKKCDRQCSRNANSRRCADRTADVGRSCSPSIRDCPG